MPAPAKWRSSTGTSSPGCAISSGWVPREQMAAVVNKHRLDLIFPESAPTLGALFQERVRRTPDVPAYRYFDQDSESWRTLSWRAVAALVARCQAALLREQLQPGDRVALMLKNCPEWVMLDQAAQGLGLVTVPLYTADRPENVAHVLGDSGARLLLIDSVAHWKPLQEACAELDALTRIVAVRDTETSDDPR
ncbi:MAG: AMP-binding protein, partial [Methylobacterium sp.]|nr:AMP-binding protein [Methylobacterium sp.]